MSVQQIAVQLENKPGMLARTCEIMAREGINIGGISIAEATDSAIIRMIVGDPQKALQALKTAGYADATTRDVVAIETPDHPGGLCAVLKPLAQAGVNVLYLYPYLRKIRDNAILIFRVDDTEKAEKVLKENWIQTLGEEIYTL